MPWNYGNIMWIIPTTAFQGNKNVCNQVWNRAICFFPWGTLGNKVLNNFLPYRPFKIPSGNYPLTSGLCGATLFCPKTNM